MHSALAAHITPNNPLLQLPAAHRFWDIGTTQGLAALNAEITRQATMIGYLDAFKLMMILTLALIPFLLLLSPAKGSSESVVIAD
jgi:DHA2 family multidrug resistance protein